MLLHHDQQCFRDAEIVIRIARLERLAGIVEQRAHLHVFHAHDLGRPHAHAGARLEGGEEGALLAVEVRQHGAAKAGEGGAGLGRLRVAERVLDGGEDIVAATVIVTHEIADTGHDDSCW